MRQRGVKKNRGSRSEVMRMKRVMGSVAVAALLMAVALPVLAGDKSGEVTLTGWVTDEWCGKANANAAGKDCAIACAKKGAQLVLASGDKIYTLPDQEEAMKHVGHEVVVRAVMAEDGSLKSAKFKKKANDKA